ncbi:MAG TPA: hypothetical protein VM261_19305 [Kofleriaceae bacterium]|nr:hypothetical protein [Kofleriaceae bacterium]
MRRSWQLSTVAGVVAAAGIAAVLAPAVTRGPTFHLYADRRAWVGIPNAGDVLSNLPFIAAGAWGLVRARRARNAGLAVAVFLAVVGVGFGSGAYHVAPSDAALVFDWAPIVLALAFLAALVVADRLDPRAGRIAAVAFPIVALASVAAWYAGGGTGATSGATTSAATVTDAGDMRWYVITQATLVAVVALGALAPAAPAAPATLHRGWILLGVAGFVAARGLHAVDRALLDAVGVSGHSAKHVLLGLSAACLVPSVHVERG